MQTRKMKADTNRNNRKKYFAAESISKEIWEDAFSVPPPQKKTEFLEYLEKENVYRENIKGHKEQAANTAKGSIGIGSFMLSQIAYIRKRVYLASLSILVMAVIAADYAGPNSIWYVAAMMPFIALCMVTESVRSETYGMTEFEMASRFSIRSIMLARFGTIGLVHMVLLCILIPIVRRGTLLSFIQIGIYLLVPYLVASVLELAAVRRYRGKEAMPVCMAISGMVGIMNAMLKQLCTYLFGAKHFIVWIVLAVYLTGRTVREYRKMIYQTEEWIV